MRLRQAEAAHARELAQHLVRGRVGVRARARVGVGGRVRVGLGSEPAGPC